MSNSGTIAFGVAGSVVYSINGGKQKTISQDVKISIYYVKKNDLVILFDSYESYIKTISNAQTKIKNAYRCWYAFFVATT